MKRELNNGKISSQDAKNYVSMLEKVKSSILKEPYYLAYLARTTGDILMASEDFESARKSYEKAAKIHTKERYLLEIGLDWYCAARASSQNGQKTEAIAAIQNALKFDRDAENTKGIASDYMAYSKILLKGNPSEEERKFAEELAVWSVKILDAGKRQTEN